MKKGVATPLARTFEVAEHIHCDRYIFLFYFFNDIFYNIINQFNALNPTAIYHESLQKAVSVKKKTFHPVSSHPIHMWPNVLLPG